MLEPWRVNRGAPTDPVQGVARGTLPFMFWSGRILAARSNFFGLHWVRSTHTSEPRPYCLVVAYGSFEQENE